jgi:penicillin amidase
MMKLFRRFLFAGLVILVIAAGLIAWVVWDSTRGMLPQTSGALTVSGLNAQVEILRDSWGVPHIYASSPHDLFFAQGYTQAQDRWWQMEFYRHIGRGTLGELLGENRTAFRNDVFIRTVGWRRAAERDLTMLSETARAQLESFAAGVNAYISGRAPDDLAFEYRILSLTGANITVDPWTPLDSLVWAKVMAWQLTSTYDRDLRRQLLIDEIGEEMMRAMYPPYPYDDPRAPTILQPEDLPITPDTLTSPVASARPDRAFALALAGGLLPEDRLGGVISMARADGVGSNNWVATGTRTASGAAMLANDMHLDPSMPSIWYTVGLHCLPVSESCPYDMVGYVFTPVPGLIVGHNGRVAWGMTNVGADVQDLYALEWNPDDPLQYRWDGAWRAADLIEEVIRFADGTPSVTVRVRVTHLGPVINDNQVVEGTTLSGFNTDDPLVLRWTGHEPASLPDALLGFARATDWESFRDGARLFSIPAQNLVFADMRGNIGYQMPGLMPIRPAGFDGLTPHAVSGDADVWQGFVPFDDLPRILNPARGVIVTANQAVVPLAYYDGLGIESMVPFSYDWAFGERGYAINRRLDEENPHSVDTFRLLHNDTYDLNAERLVPWLLSVDAPDPTLNGARDLLREWNYRWEADSRAGLVYAYALRALLANVFDDQLPESVRGDIRQSYALSKLMETPDHLWWDDARTPDVTETRDDILARALSEGVAALTAAHGTDPANWRWGDVHGTRFESPPLGASGIRQIEDIVNRTAFGFSGSTHSINSQDWSAPSGDFMIVQHSSQRLVIDFADLDRSTSILPTGQSGHPFSPHYDDMLPIYVSGGTLPLPYTRSAVETASQTRLVLSPGG